MPGTDIQKMYGAASAYTWARPETDARLEGGLLKMAAIGSSSRGSRVSDVGGGNGYYGIALAREGRHVELFDITPEMVEDAKRRAALVAETAGWGSFALCRGRARHTFRRLYFRSFAFLWASLLHA